MNSIENGQTIRVTNDNGRIIIEGEEKEISLEGKGCIINSTNDVRKILLHMDDNMDIDETKFKYVDGIYSYGDCKEEVSIDEFCSAIDNFKK